MKVPVLDGPKVSPGPLNTPQVRLDGRGAFGGPAGEALQGLGQRIDQVGQVVARVQREADEVAASDALNQLNQFTTSELDGDTKAGKTGYMATRGRAAAEASAATLERLEKERERLGKDLGARAKQLYTQRSNELLLGSRRRVESHFSGQVGIAKEATARATEEAALTAIANSYADPETVATQLVLAEQAIKGVELSPEEGAARIGALRSKAAAARLDGFLSAGDYKGAEALFGQVREQLGPAAPRFQKQIEAVKVDRQAATMASALISTGQDEDGRPLFANIQESVDKVPAGPLRDELEKHVRAGLVSQQQIFNDKIDRVSKEAFAQYNTRKQFARVDAITRAELNRLNPALYARLEEEDKQKFRRSQSSKSEADREQRRLNQGAVEDFMSLAPADRVRLDLDLTFAGSGIDSHGMGQLRVKQRQAIEAEKRGETAREDEFRSKVLNAVTGTVKSKGELKMVAAGAAARYERFLIDNKRPPSDSEAAEMAAEVLIEHESSGWFSKPKRGYQVELELQKERYKQSATKAAPKPAPADPDADLLAPIAPAAKSNQKVEVINEKTRQRGQLDAAELDSWLAQNPGWRKR